MKEVVASSISDRRFVLILLGSFSALTLLLASVGIYGVMSYAVAQRAQEIGIRMALGARRGQVLGMMMGNGARLAVAGIGIGAAGALALTRFMSAFLFGVGPTDFLTFLGMPLLFAAVALLACYLPARRAMRLDPITTLRCECLTI
jgi:ABC-type antimicrobial peptide transport system permease subunit